MKKKKNPKLLLSVGEAQVAGTDYDSPFTVLLGTADTYVILTKAGISTIFSAITGNIGTSPAAASYITGFALIADSSNVFSTSKYVTGEVFAADYAAPTPVNIGTAILDMGIAYSDAAGRASDEINREDGLVTGQTFNTGVYKWTTDINFSADIYISGSDTDIFIFQTTGNVIAGAGAKINLVGGAVATNVFWQVAGFVVAGSGAELQGNFLVATFAAFQTGSRLDGRVLSQTAVTLDQVTFVDPLYPYSE